MDNTMNEKLIYIPNDYMKKCWLNSLDNKILHCMFKPINQDFLLKITQVMSQQLRERVNRTLGTKMIHNSMKLVF